MKRISPGTVTLGVIAVGFGLLAACAIGRFFDDGPTQGPKAQTSTATVRGLPQPAPIPPLAVARNVPTLAPPQSASSLTVGGRSEPGPRGRVIYVQVEVEGVGPEGN